MYQYKPVIEINKTDETNKRILKGLIKNGEYHIEKINNENRSLLIKIGVCTKPLEPKYPIVWRQAKIRYDSKRFLKLPPDIELTEEILENKIKYRFRKRRII